MHRPTTWFQLTPRVGRVMWFALAVMTGMLSQTAHAWHIVLLVSSDAQPFQQASQAAADRLSREGYTITTRVLGSDRERDRVWLMSTRADACLAVGSEAARLMRQSLPSSARKTYCMVTDPEALGLLEFGAIGVSTDVPIESQYELIAEALPRVRTIGILYRSDQPRSRRLRERAEQALPTGWRLEAVAVNDHASAAEAIDTLMSRRIDCVWTAPDSSVYDSAVVRSLLLASVRRRIPVFGFSAAFVRAGALLGVSITPQRQGHRAGDLTIELLQRDKTETDIDDVVGEGRIVPPLFEISINLIVAEAIQIELPRTLINRAETVIRQE